jgi:hypothetical protein
MSYFSKKRWRKNEPYPIEEESSSTVDRIVSAFRYHLGYSVDELRDLMGVTADELTSMFNVDTERPGLRLISADTIRRRAK